MANGIQRVRPGDLITAQLINDLVGHIEDLEQRLSTLEGGGGTGAGVVIAAFEPANQVAMGQELRVLGSGFLFPPNLNTVTVDGQPVAEFRQGSTSAQLRFLVPTLTGSVPSSGRVVTVAVSNAAGSAQRSYRVLPEVPATGNPPAITSVQRTNGSTTLVVGDTAVIAGANFSTAPSENLIRFVVDLGGGQTHAYPEEGDSLTIQSATATEIQVVVPEMSEVPTTGSLSLTLEVTVGAHPSAVRAVTVRR